MSAFDRWLLQVKRRETPAARLAHDAYRRLMEFNLPDTPSTRRVYGALNVGVNLLTEGGEWVRAKLLYEPMLRARCESVGARVRLSSLPTIRGHGRIRIGDDCTFSSFMVVSGRFFDDPTITFGVGCHVASHVLFSVNKRITIGDRVGIAGRVAISDSDGHPSDPERRMRGEHITAADVAPVVIEDYAWIGRDAHVLKGVRIGRGAIVASGSVVATDVPEGSIAMGVPARVIRR
jgi:carbonic anhydrase/acetyltransferase-like protein (isoleucine patch superfamily)